MAAKSASARKRASKSAAKPSSKPPRDAIRIRWERRNIALISSGLGSIAIGYVLLSQGSITLAPVLLVIGYCVLVPLAFIL